MKIPLPQLTQHLKQQLASIYLISGDEHLLAQEACKQIYNHATTQGFTNKEIMHLETGFNWQSFALELNNLSLFAEKSIIELRMPTGKPGDTGGKVLQSYASNPSNYKLLIIITEKLDAATQKTKWFKAIENAGIVIQIWPLQTSQVNNWIATKMQQAGLHTNAQGIKLIAEFAEGNLLAAQQEIEKLRLIYQQGNIEPEQILAVITDNARFKVFDLIDNALGGKTKQVLRILENLKNEGTEPPIMLWAITKELRSLIDLASLAQKTGNLEQAIQSPSVHINFTRKPIIKQALQRLNIPTMQKMLKYAGTVDLIIKGAIAGNVWNELSYLYLHLCGTKLRGNL
jgi:DNA polymerase III subunit delta